MISWLSDCRPSAIIDWCRCRPEPMTRASQLEASSPSMIQIKISNGLVGDEFKSNLWCYHDSLQARLPLCLFPQRLTYLSDSVNTPGRNLAHLQEGKQIYSFVSLGILLEFLLYLLFVPGVTSSHEYRIQLVAAPEWVCQNLIRKPSAARCYPAF